MRSAVVWLLAAAILPLAASAEERLLSAARDGQTHSSPARTHQSSDQPDSATRPRGSTSARSNVSGIPIVVHERPTVFASTVSET